MPLEFEVHVPKQNTIKYEVVEGIHPHPSFGHLPPKGGRSTLREFSVRHSPRSGMGFGQRLVTGANSTREVPVG